MNADYGIIPVIEDLAFQGHETVIPAYYEVVLKEKYARDELSSQMLDLIKDTLRTEIAYTYTNYFGGMGTIFRDMIAKGLTSVASLYESKRPAAEEKMQKLIDMFLAKD